MNYIICWYSSFNLHVVNHTFFQERMIFGGQRIGAEINADPPHNDTDEQERNSKLKRHYLCVFIHSARHNHLPEIYPMAKNNQYRHKG